MLTYVLYSLTTYSKLQGGDIEIPSLMLQSEDGAALALTLALALALALT